MTTRRRKLLPQIDNRTDLSVIADWIESGSSVLDLGCGEGHLLEYLACDKGVRVMGVDIDLEKILLCMRRGIPVVQTDLNDTLQAFKDQSYDYVILSQTIHQVQRPGRLIQEILRIGRHGIISFPNFGHFSWRLKFLFAGMVPNSDMLPFDWYQTPTTHVLTFTDFTEFCRKRKITIVEAYHIIRNHYRKYIPLPNFLSEGTIALITK